MQIFQARRKVLAPAVGRNLLLLCALWAPAVQGADSVRRSVQALGERTMDLALGRWGKPMFGQNNLKELRLTYLEFRYSRPDTSYGRKVRGDLSRRQREFLQQVRLINEVVSPAEFWNHPRNWSHPQLVHRSRASGAKTTRVRKTGRASWDFGLSDAGLLAWTEQRYVDSARYVDSDTDLPLGGAAQLIKQSGLRIAINEDGLAQEDAFLVVDNGYAPQVLTLSFDGADGQLSLRNVQAGADERQLPLSEKARLRWRAGDQWEVMSYQRNFRQLGYRQSTGDSTAWPTVLGNVPIKVGDLQSGRIASQYVSYGEYVHDAKRRWIGYAEPTRMNDAELADVELTEIEFVLESPFSGTLDAMFSGTNTTGRHELPGEHNTLVLLEALRRRVPRNPH